MSHRFQNRRLNPRTVRFAVSMVFGAIAFALTLAITDSPGPGLDPDSAFYLGGAASLAAGRGYRAPIAPWNSVDSTAPIAHFPPGYPVAIALPTRLGMAPVQGARLVNAAAAFVSLGVATYLVALATGPVAAVLLGVALLLTPALVADHLEALSEPLFLACTMLALLAMVRVPLRPFASGVAAAAASLVRYAGIAATGAVIVWAFVQRGTLRQRSLRAAIAALPTIIVQGAWVRYAHAAAGQHAIRDFAVYTADFGATLAQGWSTLARWVIPVADDSAVPRLWLTVGALLVLFVLAIVLVLGSRRALAAWRSLERHTPARIATRRLASARILGATAVLVACYVVVLVASRLLADPYIPFDDRILSPFIALVEVALAVSAALVWTRALPTLRVVMLVAIACWGVAAFGITHDDVAWALTNGDDFAGDQWRRSELLDWARTNARGVPLYSNWPAAVNFHLGRPARDLPFGESAPVLGALVDTVRVRGALILDFDEKNPDFAAADTLDRVAGLAVLKRLGDGIVLQAVPR